MPASLAGLEARVAALEAERADYRAVLAAVNALGENQREHAEQLRELSNAQPTRGRTAHARTGARRYELTGPFD